MTDLDSESIPQDCDFEVENAMTPGEKFPQPEDHQSEMRDSARTPGASYFVTDSFGSESELCGNFEVYTLWGIMREIRQELRSTPHLFSKGVDFEVSAQLRLGSKGI